MLTSEQRAKLDSLKGEPFEFEQMQFMPPGPPRSRDGRREGNRSRNQNERRDDRNQDERSDKCREADKLVTDKL